MQIEKERSKWLPPPKVEELFVHLSNGFLPSGMNATTSGARKELALPVGNAKLQLYSSPTPNGFKVSIMLEELGVPYDAHMIRFAKGEQFTSGFVKINPNSKIPALVDLDGFGGKTVSTFESAAIVYYLAEKFNRFQPDCPIQRNEIRSWIFWQMASLGPMCGNLGHFFMYAPPTALEARNYGAARYGMEVKRLCHILDTHLQGREYIVGEEYSIADIVIYPWINQLLVGYKQSNGVSARTFLSMDQYPNLLNWAELIAARPGVKRGMAVLVRPSKL